MMLLQPTFTLFPYTTLFRSVSRSPAARWARTTTGRPCPPPRSGRSEEHTSELQSRQYLVCRLLLEKKKKNDSELSVFFPCERKHRYYLPPPQSILRNRPYTH